MQPTKANRASLLWRPRRTESSRWRLGLLLALSAALPGWGPSGAWAAGHGVAAGLLTVEQTSALDTNNNALVTQSYQIGSFRAGAYSRGDYGVLIEAGVDAAHDSADGVLMSCITENGRDNFGTNGYPTCCIETNGSGTFRIATSLAGGDGAGDAIEFNVNVAGAWFPYSRFLGGFARNSSDINGGTNDLFTGSPALVLGTHFKGVSAGRSIVDLRSLGIDSRTSGVLLVNHAKDENNFALSQVNTNNGTWNVFVRDNATTNYSGYEQDPVAFVFIPKTNTALISGRFNADGSIAMCGGSTPQFTVTNLGEGRWDFRLIGYSATNGVLILSPEGGGTMNADNIVNCQAYTNGEGWEIQSRDTPANELQTPLTASGGPEAVASFVFIPAVPAAISVSRTNGLVTTGTGEPTTFRVVLEKAPTADVTVSVTSSDSSKGVAAPETLLFSPTDWYVPQTVTVTGTVGAAYGAYTIVTAPAVSADSAYQGLNPDDVSVLSVPARATPVWPTNNAAEVGAAPVLKVAVTNTTAGYLTVKFYGREAPTVFPGADFAVVVMPDSQMYTAERNGGKKEMMIAQTEWAIANRVSRNIAYVTQLGDISNNGDTPAYISQWHNATNAMYRLENTNRTHLADGIPYGVAVGNHEQTPNGWATFDTTNPGTTTNYNSNFGLDHFAGRGYYAGHYSTNNNNHCDFFSAGGLDFVVLYFEFNTNPPVQLIEWANDVLQTNPQRRAIVVTHNFGNTETPVVWSSQAHVIYNALKENTNLFLFLGGHVAGQGRREDLYDGRVVRTLVQDYQSWTNGGNGFMRILDFSPSNNAVVVRTFSPVTGEYLADDDSEFRFAYDMQPTGAGAAGPYTLLATNGGVSPGSLCTCSWSGLQTNRSYQWYVTVTDSSGLTVTSPVWLFNTARANTRPSVANRSLTIVGDSPTNITLVATDPNGDSLTFQTPTVPSCGLLQNLDPAAGTVTYWPAHGFRGTDRFTFTASDWQATSSAASMVLSVVSPPDTNGNSLPDAWEAAYGITDPAGDNDGDGESNYEEYVANTNPTNAASVLRITDLKRQTNGGVFFSWPGVGGTRYRVQFCNGNTSGSPVTFNDLTRSVALEMIANPLGSVSTQSFTDDFSLTGTPSNHVRYYRIRVVQ